MIALLIKIQETIFGQRLWSGECYSSFQPSEFCFGDGSVIFFVGSINGEELNL